MCVLTGIFKPEEMWVVGSIPGGLVVKLLKQQAQVGSLAGEIKFHMPASKDLSKKQKKKKRGDMGRSKVEASRRL